MRKPHLYGFVGLLVLVVWMPQVAWGYLSDLAGHWSANLVGALEAKGVISGDGQGRFAPDSPLTRAQMAKLFVSALGYEAEASLLRNAASRYADVSERHWASGFIESLTELGIAEGYPNGEFQPDAPVTRAQLAMFLVRAAGLADRARLSRLEPTPYKDDADIPAWARGAVFVAWSEGLMMGMPNGYLYPNQPITRAEGAAVIFRLMARNGSLFHLAGTLVRYDPQARTGTVRDALGQERSFTMAPSATYMRQGTSALPEQVQVLDQVFIVLDDQGQGTFLEARYLDLQADRAVVQDGELQLTLPSGEQESRRVQSGALIFLNGRPSSLEAVSGAGPVYVVLDQTTGEVRLLDAVKASVEGLFVGFLDGGQSVRILTGGQDQQYPLGPAPIIIAEYQRAELEALLPGDSVRLALDREGRVVYLEATR